MIDTSALNFEKLNGLIPAIIIDENTGEVLMLGFMNKSALSKTIETKLVTFYSRSKERLWTKGETSGNFLRLIDIKADCDNDTILIKVKPEGPVCHTGSETCFGDKKYSSNFLTNLENLILDRKSKMPEGSYTTKLFQSGENRIIQKVGEEAIETVIAAKNNNKEELINETADLFYHILVMLAEKNVKLNEVVEKLISRHK